MEFIEPTHPVLVTGATGYVAGWIVKRLLDDGFNVHGTVRDATDRDRLGYLESLSDAAPGTLRLFSANLLETGSFATAMRGCQLVFHTASPFSLNSQEPQRDIVEPAVVGTRNVLAEASCSGNVKRVVVTSSCAAMYGDNADIHGLPGQMITEADWNRSSSLEHQPYSYSKLLAEREAWEFAKSQQQWDLITINPSLVIGPALNHLPTSASFDLIKGFVNGTLKSGVPDFGIGLVDVRDVAAAHCKAAFNRDAAGRYIVSAANSNFPEIAAALREHFGDSFPIPRRTLPKPLVWLVGPLIDKTLTRKMVSRNVGYRFAADNRRSVNELGLQYRCWKSSLVEMVQQMIDQQTIKPAGD